ncbi:LacI family DNA-binding transcriptional regulator [Amycolatopsis sp.]|uniref:LacI family DNA-binding transcriptional regulator n=1 Tax=Amycolatopsis sp. TaxID=37632 RepID=UPI002BCD5702|nr:LacI family DNA-binding transcriptional regulator [Amycolatopsis sp.]HVV11452.1 LacI family DNA-binding transcriptional regulator [Amycolatopsis sp.]
MSPNSSRPVTIKDVALRARVSKSTVARALTGEGSVSPQTLDKVLAAAEALGYRTNGIARSMITGQTDSLGVVVPSVSAPFFAHALGGVTQEAREAGYSVLLVSSDNDLALERDAVEMLLTKHVDGMIVAPVQPGQTEHLRRAEGFGVPLTVLDRPAPGLSQASSVTLDNVGASMLAIRHLLELGHRDIGIITEAPVPPGQPRWSYAGVGTTFPSWDRLEGYKRALVDAGIPYRKEYVAKARYSRDSAYEVTGKLLKARPELTALYCTDNELSVGSFGAVQDLGISCPGELSFLGFDDQEWATLVRPKLTVVEQPGYELGRTAAHDVLSAVGRQTRTRAAHSLSAQLIIRESTAPPRA